MGRFGSSSRLFSFPMGVSVSVVLFGVLLFGDSVVRVGPPTGWATLREEAMAGVDPNGGPSGNPLGLTLIGSALFSLRWPKGEGRRSERKSKEALDYAKGVIDTVWEPLLVLDSEMRVRTANRSFYEMFQASPSEVESRSIYDLGGGCWNRAELREQMEKVLPRNSEFHDLELEGVFPRLGQRTMRLNGRQIFSGNTATGTLLLAIEDITDRKRAEKKLALQADALARSNSELERFAYIASHDLQEPLRAVSSYAQLLCRRYKGRLDSDADEFMNYVVDGANRMRQLVNDLLAYSRLDSEEKIFHPTESGGALDRALVSLKMIIQESGATITRDLLPRVAADGVQLSQLFQNLVGNAIKFHGNSPPRIHVSAKESEKEWLFSVRDNGIGIDPHYVERIFIIFQRLHGRQEYPGTGIGLAVCKKIVERHGGRIWVESVPERGSTFFFSLSKQENKEWRFSPQ